MLNWTAVLPTTPSFSLLGYVRMLAEDAEDRRPLADYDTGSISDDEACYLIKLSDRIGARVVIEVGTFIGLSTTALAAAATNCAVYTCDASNDCLPSEGRIHTYPKQTSTQMLRDLIQREVRADLCFFDGVLSAEDVALLARVTHDRTVYAFHDYNFGPKIRNKQGRTYMETMPRKGIGNVNLLRPTLPNHLLVEPLDGTTLALLVPEGRV